MIRADRALTPQRIFFAEKATIEAYSNPEFGMEALASDTSPIQRGIYNGEGWEWDTDSTISLYPNRVVITNASGIVTTSGFLQVGEEGYVVLSTIDAGYLPVHAGGVLYFMGSTTVPGIVGISMKDGNSPIGGMYHVQGWRSGGDEVNKTALATDMGLIRVTGRGWWGNGWSGTRAQIVMSAASDWSEYTQETKIDMYITESGSTTLTKVASIDTDGIKLEQNKNIYIGSTKISQLRGDVAIASIFQARLSANQYNPYFTNSDSDSVHLVPINTAGHIAVYDLDEWVLYELDSPLSLSLSSLASETMHDVFVRYQRESGRPSLVIEALAWTSADTREALSTVDGVLVKNGDSSSRYVGTIYVDAANKCSDEESVVSSNVARKHLWNYYNRTMGSIKKTDTNEHTYSSTTHRKWNNNDSMSIEIVCGIYENAYITAYLCGKIKDGASLDAALSWSSGQGALHDVSNYGSSFIGASSVGRIVIPAIGKYKIVALESSPSSSTATFSTCTLEVGIEY